MSRWYAVHCKPQQDARAEEHLRNQHYEVFRPRARLRRRSGSGFRQVIESLFPRYLFVRLDSAVDWAPIRSTRGVAGLVRWGGYTPPVPDPVIEDLRGRVDDQHCIDLAGADYRPRERLRITEGLFAGYEALFHSRSGEERVVVLLEIMQRAQRLVLPERVLERA